MTAAPLFTTCNRSELGWSPADGLWVSEVAQRLAGMEAVLCSLTTWMRWDLDDQKARYIRWCVRRFNVVKVLKRTWIFRCTSIMLGGGAGSFKGLAANVAILFAEREQFYFFLTLSPWLSSIDNHSVGFLFLSEVLLTNLHLGLVLDLSAVSSSIHFMFIQPLVFLGNSTPVYHQIIIFNLRLVDILS